MEFDYSTTTIAGGVVTFPEYITAATQPLVDLTETFTLQGTNIGNSTSLQGSA